MFEKVLWIAFLKLSVSFTWSCACNTSRNWEWSRVEKAHDADLHYVDWNPHDENLIITGREPEEQQRINEELNARLQNLESNSMEVNRKIDLMLQQISRGVTLALHAYNLNSTLALPAEHVRTLVSTSDFEDGSDEETKAKDFGPFFMTIDGD
ncbi:WD-40 repeat-containing protein MSI4 [Camellia lanceoleosa]|uniref:WD-40 repeat-containing protein MSI4 n=1 Tax=Camellia lanceoleosa TaxID=1840588 RepID=A0ACC0FCH7_9ERIC|nr:WD-40 repeat-containing protein MSI4 [Camellia lanceoleosa]